MQEFNCPQCGCFCDELVEGYCEDCTESNYHDLLSHILSQDIWNSLTDEQKTLAIKKAYE